MFRVKNSVGIPSRYVGIFHTIFPKGWRTDQSGVIYFAAASHEFKTPLTLLRGYLEMLQEDCLPEAECKNAEMVMISEIDRLDRLVLNMLDLSYVESDAFEIHTEPFLLNDLVRRYATEFQQQFMEKKISFDISGSQKQYMVLADQEGIGRVLSNFLSNAIKNTEIEGTVSLRLQETDGQVKVSVYNQGDHIEEKLMEQIWIPFYRVDRSRVRDRKGTGLGLSICREILLRHNSRYGVHNVNDGVEFYFWLPLADPTKY